MSSFFLRCGLALSLCLGFTCLTAGTPLPRSTPEEQGISSAAILSFIDDVEKKVDALHSIMVVRHGQVVAEGWWTPYSAETPHQLYSLSKSFTSTAIGLLVAEGKISTNDFVLPYFPDHAPADPNNNLKIMRIRDLLIMSTGHETEAPIWGATEPWAKIILAQPVPHRPGTHFRYNSPATYMLSAIVQKITSQTVLDYLRPRLFEPLGIEHPTWDANEEGISIGASGLNLRTEDIAKFGQLYLQKGRWNGQQLLPEKWVTEATALHTSSGNDPNHDGHQGYGYQFWRSRHNAYQANGAFGQLCIVMPDQDTVIAITSGLKGTQAVMDLVWTHFLPALQVAPLPADAAAHALLTARLTHLTLPVPVGVASPPQTGAFAGRRYVFAPNSEELDSFSFEPAPGGAVTFHVSFNGKEQTFTCLPNVWQKTRLSYNKHPEAPYAICGAWTTADTYTLKFCASETPYIQTVRVKFSGDTADWEIEPNVGWGPIKIVKLTGQRVAAENP